MFNIWKFPKASRAAQSALAGHIRPACLRPLNEHSAETTESKANFLKRFRWSNFPEHD